ncbi:MAG: aminotransferase class V-fold PLP-dependent enzyme [Planctomycetia bacterium]|nr:aminotransferase class V-fold PLP-dependent enzyme [Planctomycetia bacterium]
MNNSHKCLKNIQSDFIGLDTLYTRADGKKTKRIYLDSTASTLMMKAAYNTIESFYNHYSNTHSLLHFSAKIATQNYKWAHDRILSFVKADAEKYACFFTGSGTTAGINRMARVFRDFQPDRDVALVSLMEHHSNDLPHRKHAGKVVHVPLDDHDGQPGCINMNALKEELEKYKNRINYIAMTGVSNVTGIINPIYDIAELAHKYGALILVDGAQMAAHLPIQMTGHSNPLRNIDALVFSGHKTYVPGSPGVVICRKDILSSMEPEEVGGGMVDQVHVDRYTISDQFPDREEAGTPNIPGAIGLAAAIDVLDKIGMELIYQDETVLITDALNQINQIEHVIIYGETNCSLCPRAASISFNIRGLDHGLVAAILNDYYNIAVRNACFCAHPYVKEMIIEEVLGSGIDFDEIDFNDELKIKAGMVRASFGIYSTQDDVKALVFALKDIVAKRVEYSNLYSLDNTGTYCHKTFKPDEADLFSIESFINDYLQNL